MGALEIKGQYTPPTHKEAGILCIVAELIESNFPLTVKEIASNLKKPYCNEFIATTVKEITDQEIS